MNDEEFAKRLDRIETVLQQLTTQRLMKEYYSTSEVAKLVKRSEFTVREWCRLGRIAAEKRACGRGRSQEWMIPHDELLRFQCEGLLPIEH
ncbi:MAG: helix-turn-helix domain-containing protein [Planctomycetaceae bacterium]|nr:helix-turn-helix domain-containing protein [Planctomycetaceae bacterium]